ncbi:hypothetical protein CCUG74246_07125 [Fusobacterium watanabei]
MSDLTIKNILQKDIERKINEMFEVVRNNKTVDIG